MLRPSNVAYADDDAAAASPLITGVRPDPSRLLGMRVHQPWPLLHPKNKRGASLSRTLREQDVLELIRVGKDWRVHQLRAKRR